MAADLDDEHNITGDEVVGWNSSPRGAARIFARGGYLHDGEWKDVGIVRLVPPGGPVADLVGFQRPMEAVINDEGYAAVSDHLRHGEMDGTLTFIAPNGKISRQYRLPSKITDLCLEPLGRQLFLKEGDQLSAYWMMGGERVWSIKVPRGGLRVLAPDPFILVGEPYGGSWSDYIMKVGFAGEVVERWPASGYEAIEYGERHRKAGEIQSAVRWFRAAAASEISPHFLAKAHRALGELAEMAERSKEALLHFESALSLDPGSGVKKKIRTMQKRVQSQNVYSDGR